MIRDILESAFSAVCIVAACLLLILGIGLLSACKSTEAPGEDARSNPPDSFLLGAGDPLGEELMEGLQ